MDSERFQESIHGHALLVHRIAYRSTRREHSGSLGEHLDFVHEMLEDAPQLVVRSFAHGGGWSLDRKHAVAVLAEAFEVRARVGPSEGDWNLVVDVSRWGLLADFAGRLFAQNLLP